MVFVKSEPQDTWTDHATLSTVNVSSDKKAPAVSHESSSETRPICDCGKPVAEKPCLGVRNPKNKGRMMYVCAQWWGGNCKYFRWKDETSRNTDDQIKQEPQSIPQTNKTPERETKPATMDMAPTASPSLPLSPEGTYTCDCGKPALQFFCRQGRPENINKYYYKCGEVPEKCKYWKWIENNADAQERVNSRKRKRVDDNEVETSKKWMCHCGRPAIRIVTTNGMPHNIGRPFYKCSIKKCKFWVWADGTLPFSDEAQARFNDWMDGQFGCWDGDW